MANSDSVSGRLAAIAKGGGPIPRKASPSGGRNVDDVRARLSPGEFVIPKAAVAARGPGYWASQELEARGKPVSSKSVASAVYAPKRGGAQRFDEGGTVGGHGFGDSSYGFGGGASGFAPAGVGQGIGGTAASGSAMGVMGSGTQGMAASLGWGAPGGSSTGSLGGGWGVKGSLGAADGGQGGANSAGGGRGGSGVGQGNASSGGGGHSTGSYGGGGGSAGGGGSTGSYGGGGGAAAGSAGGTSGGGHGGVYGLLGIDPRSVAYGPGVTPSQGGMYGGVSNFGSGLGFGQSPMSPGQTAALRGQVNYASPVSYASPNPSLSFADALALVRGGGAPSAWGTPGVSVPSSLTGSPIGQAAQISIPSSLTGSPIGQAASISVPSSTLMGNAAANAFAPGAGTPANFGQPATRGVNALAQYGIGPTMGVGMPGSAGRASPTIASLVGPRSVSTATPATSTTLGNQARGGYAPQPVFGNRGGR